jgi:hypothetical protein
VHPDGDIERTMQKIEQRRVHLDQPSAPPHLQPARNENVRCGTCKMFDPARRVCWSYETQDGQDYPVTPGEVCDSWALSPTGQKILDDGGFAPMSGGTGSGDGLQMVPKVAGGKKKCPRCGARVKRGRCTGCGRILSN